jgi:hypothetical protein
MVLARDEGLERMGPGSWWRRILILGARMGMGRGLDRVRAIFPRGGMTTSRGPKKKRI